MFIKWWNPNTNSWGQQNTLDLSQWSPELMSQSQLLVISSCMNSDHVFLFGMHRDHNPIIIEKSG